MLVLIIVVTKWGSLNFEHRTPRLGPIGIISVRHFPRLEYVESLAIPRLCRLGTIV